MPESPIHVVRTAARYLGSLKCEAMHVQSGQVLPTAAPVDNQGDGSSFSPTDLVGTSLGTCMLTTMAIAARRDGVELEGVQVTVEKEMTRTPPRQIARLACVLTFPAHLEEPAIRKLVTVAEGCPVRRSLHPDIDVPIVVGKAE